MEGAVADKRLAERVALVTGGSRGIGAAIAARLAKDGAKVVVNYLQSEVSAARVVEEIEAAGGHAIALRGDVSQVDSASALVSKTLKRFGAFDVLVNNAAINKAAPLDRVTEKSFDEHFAANGSRSCLPPCLPFRWFGRYVYAPLRDLCQRSDKVGSILLLPDSRARATRNSAPIPRKSPCLFVRVTARCRRCQADHFARRAALRPEMQTARLHPRRAA